MGNRNNYLHHLSCTFNRYGIPQEEASAFIKSQFTDFPADETASLINSAYAHTDEFNTCKLNGTQKRILRIEQYISEHYETRYNEVLHIMEYRRRHPDTEKPEPFRILDEMMENSIWIEINELGYACTVKTIIQQVHSDLNALSDKIKEKVASGEFPDIKYSCILREGIPEEEILRYAKEQRPKVIIMGTRGKSQKDIDLIGSVTAEIIDRSRTAVLAIPENTPFKEFNEVKRIAFLTNFDQRDLIAFEAFFNTWKSFHFSVSLIHLAESKDTWNEIKLAGIKDYFQKQYPGLEIHYDVVMNDNLLKGLDQYIKDNQIDIITLTSYKRNIFARLFNPSIARKMIFHSDTPLLVINIIPSMTECLKE